MSDLHTDQTTYSKCKAEELEELFTGTKPEKKTNALL